MLQDFRHFPRLEAVRPGFALVSDASVVANEIEAVRPGGVSDFGGVRQVVDQRRDFDCELRHARTRERAAFLKALGAGHTDLVFTDYFPENDIMMDYRAPHKNTLRPIQSLEQFLHVGFVNHKIEALFSKVLKLVKGAEKPHLRRGVLLAGIQFPAVGSAPGNDRPL